jgi:putative ABC transport system permease protein
VNDVRAAIRNLRAAPAYTAAAVISLALAIATNTAIFGVAYAVLLRPLPIHDPASLVFVWESDPARAQPVMELTYRQVERWSSEVRSFERLAAISSSPWPVVLEGTGDPARLPSTAVSGTFFETLGAKALLGRVLSPDDDRESQGYVAVLSYDTWMQRFGGDRQIVGRSVRLDRRPYTIVGVMPRDFDFLRGTDVWTPVVPRLRGLSAVLNTDVLANVGVLHVIGRINPGVRRETAREELAGIAARLSGSAGPPRQIVVTPFLDHTFGPVREGLRWLLGAVGILMLVACANISGLTLTRAALRRREHGIRLALGATRAQVARLWLAETAVLGLAGGIAGVLAARWLLAAIVALAPDDLPRMGDVGINVPVIGFTLALTVLATLLCAMAAVLQASSARIGEVLNETARATSGPVSNRFRSVLVVGQIALAVMLLVCAALVARSFLTLRRLDVGFDPTNVLTLAVEPSIDERPMREWFSSLLARVDALPGVEASGAVYLRPLAYGAIGYDTTMLYEGQGGTFEQAVEQGEKNPKLNFQMATPGYFRAMRIPLLRGRLFDSRDHADAPRVAVIGERAAARLWPGQNPIGQRLNTPQTVGGTMTSAWHTVIGVVKDVHYRGINDVRLDLYEPAAQSYARPEFLVIRTAGDPLALAAAVQAQVRELDRGAVVSAITTFEAVLARELAPWQLSSWMLATLAAVTFVLAIVGLIGLLGLEVAQRLREFAVRIALGADARHLRGHVFRSAAARGISGLVFGVLAALAAAHSMRALLVGITPVDVTTYGMVTATVGLTVLAVSLVPALRAARTNPIDILKRD